MIKQLMSSRRFAPLFWAQFCSALNDNVLKNALVIMILYGVASGHGDALVTVAGAVFIFPFFVLSALGGELADKYVKSVVARRLKFAEIFAACFAAAGFFLHSVPLLFVALALFGIVAALFGPVKYGILPDQLSTAELATGNALVEGATFMAILIGTIAGGLFVSGVDCIWAGFRSQWSGCRSSAGRLLRGSRRRCHRRPILRSRAIPGPRRCGC